MDVEAGAMHNNFAWSEAFTGNEMITAGNSQVRAFAKAIITMTKAPAAKRIATEEL